MLSSDGRSATSRSDKAVPEGRFGGRSPPDSAILPRYTDTLQTSRSRLFFTSMGKWEVTV